MGENDPSRRRAGDDTRQRIDELAGGWSMPGTAAAPEVETPPPPTPTPPPPPRAKRPSAAPASPPPPPPRRPSPPPPPVVDDTTAREPRFDADALRADTARGDASAAPVAAPPVARRDATEDADATRVDPRDDATGDATTVAPGAPSAATASHRHAATGSVRAIASLPRKRGLGGDLRYVATVLFGVTRSRRELARVEADLVVAAAKRRKRLIDLATRVMSDDEIRHQGVAEAREQLATIEEARARQAGQAAAAEAEATAARRDHADDVKRLTAEVAAGEAEVADLTAKLAPLERDATALRRKATELRTTLERIAAKIASTEASLVSVKGPRGDRAGVEAELATLRADRVAVQRDEPVLAGELDALLPRIAELEARRTATRAALDTSRTELGKTAERLQERLGVVGAHLKVIDRALAESQAARDRALAELGERLALDRPRGLVRELVAVEELDVDLATDQRRVMELREVIGSVDKKALFRGVAVLLLAAAAVAGFALWIVTR